jgi:hypothetical protein
MKESIKETNGKWAGDGDEVAFLCIGVEKVAKA